MRCALYRGSHPGPKVVSACRHQSDHFPPSPGRDRSPAARRLGTFCRWTSNLRRGCSGPQTLHRMSTGEQDRGLANQTVSRHSSSASLRSRVRVGWRRFCGALSQRPSRVASTSATCGVASEVRGDLIPSLVVATAAEAVQAISSIGDVTRARKSPGTGASTDSSVVIVLHDTSQRPQRPCP